VQVYVSLDQGDFGPVNLVFDNFGTDQEWKVDQHPHYIADLTGDKRGDIIGFGDAGVSHTTWKWGIPASQACNQSFRRAARMESTRYVVTGADSERAIYMLLTAMESLYCLVALFRIYDPGAQPYITWWTPENRLLNGSGNHRRFFLQCQGLNP